MRFDMVKCLVMIELAISNCLVTTFIEKIEKLISQKLKKISR